MTEATVAYAPFVWYDLATTDPEAAAAFYADIIGWTAQPIPEMSYTLLSMGETRAAGVMTLPPHLQAASVPPHWSGYIGVPDVDAMTERVTEAGGIVKYAPTDIPGIGRFAVVAEPDGAVFTLFTAIGSPAPDPEMMAPGSVGWHELRARDHHKAFDFFGALFGWELGRAVDMGPMGTYQLFGYGGADRGGMMNAPGGMHPSWLFYFVVVGIDAAKDRVEAAGGAVLHGPQEVPGGAWTLLCQDPQGAAFALVSASR